MIKMPNKILLIFLLCLIPAPYAFSQSDTSAANSWINTDSLKPGKYYYLYTSDGSVIFGKLVTANKERIVLSREDETVSLGTLSVMKYSDTFLENEQITEDNPMISSIALGTGLVIPLKGHGSIRYLVGPGLFFNYTIYTGNHLGFRGDFDYTHIGREVQSGYNESGGAYNDFSMRVNFIIGDFYQKEISYYAFAGGGIGLYRRGIINYVYNGQQRVDDMVNGFDAVLDFGVAVIIPVSKKLKIHTEGQMNYWADNTPDYFILKAGVSF